MWSRKAAWLLAATFGLAATPAHALDTTVRPWDGAVFKPYVLGQLDEASFRESAASRQAAGFNPRRLRLGGRLTLEDQVQLGFIWDFGHNVGDVQRLFEAQASYIGVKPFRVTAGVFKVNFGLESMQGAGDYLFLERASIVTITRSLAAGIRREAVQLGADGDSTMLRAR